MGGFASLDECADIMNAVHRATERNSRGNRASVVRRPTWDWVAPLRIDDDIAAAPPALCYAATDAHFGGPGLLATVLHPGVDQRDALLSEYGPMSWPGGRPRQQDTRTVIVLQPLASLGRPGPREAARVCCYALTFMMLADRLDGAQGDKTHRTERDKYRAHVDELTSTVAALSEPWADEWRGRAVTVASPPSRVPRIPSQSWRRIPVHPR